MTERDGGSVLPCARVYTLALTYRRADTHTHTRKVNLSHSMNIYERGERENIQ